MTLSSYPTKFGAALNVPAIQLVHERGVHRCIRSGSSTEALVVSAASWLSQLP